MSIMAPLSIISSAAAASGKFPGGNGSTCVAIWSTEMTAPLSSNAAHSREFPRQRMHDDDDGGDDDGIHAHCMRKSTETCASIIPPQIDLNSNATVYTSMYL